VTTTHAAEIEVCGSLDEIDPAVWDRTLATGPTDVVFLTWRWQRAWWDSYGRGRLLVLVARTEDEPVLIAPLFIDGGMVFLVGSGGSDQLDLIGDTSDATVLDGILRRLLEEEPGLLGLRLYHVPDGSPTPERLAAAARRAGWRCVGEEWLECPSLDVGDDGSGARAAADRASLRRHDRALRKERPVEIEHLTDGAAIAPHLDAFFDQHIARWAPTEHPSLFLADEHRAFYRRVTEQVAPGGALRFTIVRWDGEPVAFHFGTCHAGRFLWYKPSFAVEHARRSPGEVLLRSLFLRAAEEGARVFDFGLGNEAFKLRFADSIGRVQTWGLYP
jgi:CelD/BcsL family acetyltransferase involved in cellulose biosynthesis